MRKVISVAVIAAAMSVSAVSAQSPARNRLCDMRCQYACMAVYPAGTPEWQQCYLDCVHDECRA